MTSFDMVQVNLKLQGDIGRGEGKSGVGDTTFSFIVFSKLGQCAPKSLASTCKIPGKA